MISELLQGGLKAIVTRNPDRALEDGPCGVIQSLINTTAQELGKYGDPEFYEYGMKVVREIEANRQECEQFVAGLLGMM